jgi:hypothetical protein
MANHVVRIPPLRSALVNLLANPSASGQSAVLAAVPGSAIRVCGLAIVATTANAVKFQSNNTDISATFPLGANGGLILPFNEHGWFQTAVGEALNINMGTATATGVQVQYILVQADRG